MMSDRDPSAGPATEERELTCREVVELVTAYLEDLLDPSERALLDAHLVECDDCTTYFDQMRQTISALRAQRTNGVSAETKDALLAQFRRWRSAQGR